MIMKILAVFVLVFLTGCNGAHQEHLSQYQVEMVQDAYWKYVQKSTMTSEDSVEDIRYSPPGQYLCSLISQSINVIHKFFRLVYAHIVLWTTDFFHKLCHEVDHLHHELEHFLHHLEDDIHYHAKELAAQIRCKLEDLKNALNTCTLTIIINMITFIINMITINMITFIMVTITITMVTNLLDTITIILVINIQATIIMVTNTLATITIIIMAITIMVTIFLVRNLLVTNILATIILTMGIKMELT
ncbi:hypothetical protein CHARACLAT_025651 [Characodon lateralis]|uniref:Uncharacterized protein n=1 Tax=Characodon lateralis TaxID=208331 RepID=A0ABU7DK71_9TELE|nr:hypothetical protein [Characodon lateralis]